MAHYNIVLLTYLLTYWLNDWLRNVTFTVSRRGLGFSSPISLPLWRAPLYVRPTGAWQHVPPTHRRRWFWTESGRKALARPARSRCGHNSVISILWCFDTVICYSHLVDCSFFIATPLRIRSELPIEFLCSSQQAAESTCGTVAHQFAENSLPHEFSFWQILIVGEVSEIQQLL